MNEMQDKERSSVAIRSSIDNEENRCGQEFWKKETKVWLQMSARIDGVDIDPDAGSGAYSIILFLVWRLCFVSADFFNTQLTFFLGLMNRRRLKEALTYLSQLFMHIIYVPFQPCTGAIERRHAPFIAHIHPCHNFNKNEEFLFCPLLNECLNLSFNEM